MPAISNLTLLASLSLSWLAVRIYSVGRQRFDRLRDIEKRYAYLLTDLNAMTCQQALLCERHKLM